MSPDPIDAHIGKVRELSKPGLCLGPDAANQSVRNPEWFAPTGGGRFEPRAARRTLHRELRAQILAEAPKVQADHQAIVLAGPPGAGKSMAKNGLLTTDAERATYLRVDADDFKKLLLGRAIEDGSYDSWLKPAEIKRLEAQGQQFFPMELASLVHEESSLIAMGLRVESIRQGTNLVIDGVLGSEEKAVRLGDELEAAGYEVRVVDVEVPFEISEDGIRDRWRKAYEDALSGRDPMGGRWVPSEYARDVFDGPVGKSRPEHAARVLAERCGAVIGYQLHRVDSAHYRATGERKYLLEVDLARTAPGDPLLKNG